MKNKGLFLFLVRFLAVVTFSSPILADEETTQTDIGTLDKESAAKAFPSKPPYSPYAGCDFPTRPFFGDTHVHTSFSMDAGAFGCRLGPGDAYRPEFRAARDQSGDARNAKNSLLARWDKRRKMAASLGFEPKQYRTVSNMKKR